MTAIKKRMLAIFAAFLLLAVALFAGITPATAFAATNETKYTGVMQDLRKDSDFLFNDGLYPAVADDYSLQVIQIAESVDKELFVYVYQPSGETKPLAATSINISTGINGNLSYKNYKLTAIDTQGVFGKYLVDDFTVKSDTVRYYDISSVFRKWDKDIDNAPTDDNTISEVSFAVGKLFTACSVGNSVTYTETHTETILITNKHVGFVRYNNGFFLCQFNHCDSHYVAFSTDRQIDKLLEADVYFVSQWYLTRHTNSTGNDTFESGDDVENIVTLKYDEVASNPADGLFGKKYTWKRIESVADFVKNEDLTDYTKTALSGMQWVLRFYETEYKQTYNDWYTQWESTNVSEVSILRLKFETNGKIYNLGVVDNKQTGDRNPDNNNTFEFDFSNWGKLNWLKWVLAIVAVILLCVFLAPLLPYIIQAVIWVVLLPFKAIGALFKGIKKRGKQSGKKKK